MSFAQGDFVGGSILDPRSGATLLGPSRVYPCGRANCNQGSGNGCGKTGLSGKGWENEHGEAGE